MGFNLLETIKKADQTLVLATEVGGILIPIIKGVAGEIKQLTEGGSITYTVAIRTGNQNLKEADAAFNDVIKKVNEERAKASLPPLQTSAPV
jgi:hypothetical protein